MDDKPASPASYADFENEAPGGWLRTVVQFFAIPMLIVGVAVGIYLGINLLVGSGPKDAADYTRMLESDTINRRWQALHQLADRLRAREIPAEFRDEKLIQALCNALERARAAKSDPPRMAHAVLLIMQRLKDPRTLESARSAVDDEHEWIRSEAVLALGALGDQKSRGRIAALAMHDDHGTRQAALQSLVWLDQVEGMDFHLSTATREIAKKHLVDPHEDVRFTAAFTLADAGDRASLPVLLRMLDRDYLEGFDFDERLQGISQYKIHSNVIVRAIQRVVALNAGDNAQIIAMLRKRTDTDFEGDNLVRKAAREALAKLNTN